ncbi:NupC/NupG family nucleoside CNT transporter [Malonomonas rubra]|uniref:NupC/NupG family nucleoside CNT transporter n=1 Tax=Malonomonas rubra TaxID=57040 RepID=UPI0026F0D4FE|nr:nucleoside transporter C-terminal domain-containing protein [Malonomonas rubra]
MALRGLVGILFLLLLSWLCSERRRDVNWRLVIVGVGLQFFLALLLLKLPAFKDVFLMLNRLTLALEEATAAGTSVVFGFLGGADLPYVEHLAGGSFILAFRALPIVLVISALSALLFYWRFLPLLVKSCSVLLEKSLQIGGAVGIAAAANVFVGMVEAPLLVKPYLSKMSRGELFILMVCGMSTIAGTVLVLYASILRETLPGALGHILTASIISAPAAIVVAALMVPHQGEITVGREIVKSEARGAMDAITTGTIDGIKLLLNIVGMLIVLIALVSFCNQLLGLLPEFSGAPLTLQRLLGMVTAPVVWLLGVPWDEAFVAGGLLGTKTIINEFVAYLQLAAIPMEQLGERSRLIMVYAMCGFANFGSLGIMIGGLGAMAPERRDEIVSLGMKSILAGVIATCMTGAVVGLIY